LAACPRRRGAIVQEVLTGCELSHSVLLAIVYVGWFGKLTFVRLLMEAFCPTSNLARIIDMHSDASKVVVRGLLNFSRVFTGVVDRFATFVVVASGGL